MWICLIFFLFFLIVLGPLKCLLRPCISQTIPPTFKMKYNTLSQKEQAKRHAYPQHHADAQGRYESNLTRPSWCLRLDSSSDVPVHIFAFPNGAGDPPLLSYFSPQLYGILGLRLGNGHWSAILCFQLVQPGAANADYPFYYHFFFIRSLVCDDRVRCYSADNSQSSHKKIKIK